MSILVDSSVILDIFTDDPVWADWSEGKMAVIAESHDLIINDIIWTECSAAFKRIEDYCDAISEFKFKHVPLPREALFLAGKAFIDYRRDGGKKSSPLPDFFIGAHAAVAGIPLLTRDPRRITRHFPTVNVVSP